MIARRLENLPAFTLIELLVAIAIIALLMTVLMPSLQGVRDLARQVTCQAAMRNIGSGNAAYAATYDSFWVHGRENISFSGNAFAGVQQLRDTGNGWPFFPTHIFDDDLPSAPGDIDFDAQTITPAQMTSVSDTNLWNVGGQNLAGVGALMWDYFIEENARSIICSQSDHDEVTKYTRNPASFNYGFLTTTLKQVAKAMATSKAPTTLYWRNDLGADGAPSAYGQVFGRAGYAVRGPMFRSGEMTTRYWTPSGRDKIGPSVAPPTLTTKGDPLSDSDIAMFADHESADPAKFAAKDSDGDGEVAIGDTDESAAPNGWPRRHKKGVSTLYADSSVFFIPDESREITVNGDSPNSQVVAYHNGWSIYWGYYDYRPTQPPVPK